VAPSEDQAERAGQLASDALQALILGDLEGARTLLSQATAADASSAEFAYRHARVLEDMELAEAAILEYCRSLALGAVAAGIMDSRRRLDALYEVVRERISDRALDAFVAGIRQADLGLFADAASSFAVAIEETPDWSAPVYNRAIVLERLGLIQESLAEYRRYLRLTPSEVDPVVVNVSERIGMLEGELARPTPNPRNVLALGVVFPGMGQYYSGRSRHGTIVLSAAAMVVLTGLTYKEVTVRCLVPVQPDADCPPGEVHDETARRPFLGPALGATAAVMVGAAVEAYLRARKLRDEQIQAIQATTTSGFRVLAPSVTTSAGRVQLALLRLSFR
jgi:tetratricopeptide (TPR) repeat protein